MNTEFEIIAAEKADIEQILLIQESRGLSPWSPDGYASELERSDSLMLVAREQGAVLGFLAARIPKVPNAESELFNIATLPQAESRGIGSALLETYLQECRVSSVRTVWLEVRASNERAIRFYEMHGFTKSGTRRNFYSGPVEDAILMSVSPAGEVI